MKNSGKVEKKAFRFLELLIESIAWLQIVASPLLIGVIIGAFIYFSKPTMNRLVISIIIALIGLVIGVVWATKKWRGKGALQFISQVIASSDLDNINNKKPNLEVRKNVE